MAKAFFGVRGIPYEEIDVSRDGAAREAISRKFGAKSVPVVELESEVMIGFDRERLLEIFRED
jgi:glutaredoxin